MYAGLNLHWKLLSEPEKPDCDYDPEEICAVLAAVTQDMNARLALGIQDKKSAEIILQSLWLGIPVFMDFSVPRILKGKACANKNLELLYERYKEDVKKLGAKEILPGEYLVTIKREFLGGSKESAEEALVQSEGRAFITCKDIMKYADSRMELEIPQNEVITEYASDMAGKKGITLRRTGERC